MSDSNTVEINFLDASQIIIPLKDNEDNLLSYNASDSMICYESYQGTYVMYPWHTIKSVKFTP